MLLLVSACSTFAPSPARNSATGPEGTSAESPLEGLQADGLASRPYGVRPPLNRSSARRSAASPRPRPQLPLDSFVPSQDEQAAVRALVDRPPEEAGLDTPPVAGPEPKLEPLANHANRPYRLRGRQFRPMTDLRPFKQRGIASWYGTRFHGRRTATGEHYDMHSMSAAHPTLPLPSYVKVTNLKSGTSIIVRVNDRGPFAHDRVIDLSKAAASHLGMIEGGVAAVEVNLIVPEPAGVGTPAAVAVIID
jgi:rare lipoprotein A